MLLEPCSSWCYVASKSGRTCPGSLRCRGQAKARVSRGLGEAGSKPVRTACPGPGDSRSLCSPLPVPQPWKCPVARGAVVSASKFSCLESGVATLLLEAEGRTTLSEAETRLGHLFPVPTRIQPGGFLARVQHMFPLHLSCPWGSLLGAL